MEKSKVTFIPLNKAAIIPKTHSEGAAGYDLFSICDGTIPSLSTMAIKLGFSLHLPPTLVGYICGRSGIGRNNGVAVVKSYVKSEDEVIVYLKNFTETPFNFDKGMRIAQMFFAVTEDLKFNELSTSS